MNILRGDVAEVNLINLRADLHVARHAGRSDDVLQGKGRICRQSCSIKGAPSQTVSGSKALALFVDHPDFLHHFKQSRTAGNSVCLQGRRYSQTDGFLCAAGIGDDKVRAQRIQSPVHAFGRSVEGLQIDGNVGFVHSGCTHENSVAERMFENKAVSKAWTLCLRVIPDCCAHCDPGINKLHETMLG